jgi:hypothetical protein
MTLRFVMAKRVSHGAVLQTEDTQKYLEVMERIGGRAGPQYVPDQCVQLMHFVLSGLLGLLQLPMAGPDLPAYHRAVPIRHCSDWVERVDQAAERRLERMENGAGLLGAYACVCFCVCGQWCVSEWGRQKEKRWLALWISQPHPLPAC